MDIKKLAKLSAKYSIDIDKLQKDLYPQAKEIAVEMGRGSDENYIISTIENMIDMEESYKRYISIYESIDSVRYKSIFDEEVESTDIPVANRPEYPVGMTVAEVNKKKDEFDTVEHPEIQEDEDDKDFDNVILTK